MTQGAVRIGVQAGGSYVSASHGVETDQQEKDPATLQPKAVQAAQHEIDLWLFDVSLRWSLALGARFAWEGRIPFRFVGASATFRDAAGGELANFESIHHRDEVLAGIGDIELGGRFRVLNPDQHGLLLDLSAGLSFPTGGLEDNPFARGARGLEHQHIFFGTGTLDPYVGLSAARDFGALDIALWSAFRTSLYSGSRGYRAGTKLTVGAAAGGSLGLDDWYFTLGPELYHESSADWGDGRVAVNSGRTDLSAAGGVFWRGSEQLQPYLTVKKPFTLSVAGGQLELPLVVAVGADFTFGLFGDATKVDEHRHGEGDDHGGKQPGDGDVEDVGLGGNTFVLKDALVPGKITVIDFWATWCHPCEHIDSALSSLAKKHSDLAVRKAEVIDEDSPVAQVHLGGDIVLPIVWIYDRNGKLLHKLTGTDEKKLRAVLEPLLTK